MAKTGVVEPDPPAASRTAELKKELQRLVRTIVDDDVYGTDAIDQARQALLALKDLKTKKGGTRSMSLKLRGTVSCPEEFLCPVSKDVMRDPVIVATGQTYDRVSIKKWLKAGNRTCPQTQQVLSHTILTPNHLIRDMISKWCKSQGIELPNPVQYIDEDMPTNAERSKFVSLINKTSSSSMAEQKEAAKELRCLTKKMPSFRALFGESPDAIAQLLNPIAKLKSETGEVPIDFHEDVITTLLNLSIHDSNKEIVAETPNVIPLLVDGLKAGTIQIRSNAAAALFTLSALKPNKRLIGDSGALKPLINLIEEGHPLAMNDAASAIFSLCMINENRAKAVEDGAVIVIMKKIETRSYVDELVTILAILSTHPRAIDEMAELRAVPFLLRSIRESSCSQNKENCVAILHAICSTYRNKLKDMREEEDRHQTLSELARSGTSRAKRKASGILERLHRTINLTHTA